MRIGKQEMGSLKCAADTIGCCVLQPRVVKSLRKKGLMKLDCLRPTDLGYKILKLQKDKQFAAIRSLLQEQVGPA